MTKITGPKNKLRPLIKFNGRIVLNRENLALIFGGDKTGKSTVCEAICASAENPKCPSMKFKAFGKVLYLDTERCNPRHKKAYLNFIKRAGAIKRKNVTFCGINAIAQDYSMFTALRSVLDDEGDFDIVILDSLLDFLVVPHSNMENIDFGVKQLKMIAADYNIGIIGTANYDIFQMLDDREYGDGLWLLSKFQSVIEISVLGKGGDRHIHMETWSSSEKDDESSQVILL